MPYYEYVCELKYAKGCLKAAVFYSKGLGTEKNYQKSLKFYKNACVNKNGKACYTLSLLFIEGLNVEKDIKMAFEYALKSCLYKFIDGCVLVDNLIDAKLKDYKIYSKQNFSVKDVLKLRVFLWTFICSEGNKKEYCKKLSPEYLKLFDPEKDKKIINKIKEIIKENNDFL